MISENARDLSLTIINSGAGYAERCAIARASHGPTAALMWAHLVNRAARAYEREFNAGKPMFSVTDLLATAIELADYYGDHVREIDAAREARVPVVFTPG